jgi:hypothetical protein
MNGAKAVRKYTVAEATMHGACAICAVLRHRQTRLIEESGVPAAKHLCNHHAWALAKSAPAFLAADLLLQTLRTRREEGILAARTPCDFCEHLLLEETRELKKLETKMRARTFLEWMRLHGALCLHHAKKISAQLPHEGEKVIAELLSRGCEELEADLANYTEQARRGEHAGGVLGRAAEFLVCQRGIPGEETPC